MWRSRATTPITALAMGLLAAAAGAQEATGPLPGIFGEVLDVRVVNLEVVVTDRDGVPIVGLGAQDFRLIVDDEEVPIDYFSEVRGGRAVAAGEREGELPSIPQLAPGDRVGTSYLVFIDDYFSLKPDRNRVIDGLVDDLALLGPQDRMAVVAYDGQDLEMLSTWSSSYEGLRRVFTEAKQRPAKGLQREAERRQLGLDETLTLSALFDEELTEGFDSAQIFRTQLSAQERSYVQRLSNQLDRVVAAASATLRSFAKPPGRKVMLLFSGSWPYFPTEYLVADVNRVLLDRQGLEGENLYRRLSDTANLLGYTLYPVDNPGLDRDVIDTERTLDRFEAGVLGPGHFREQEVHYTLEFLARETGGRAFVNASRSDAFASAVSDTRSYYWIGFSPDRAWDDERHEVRLEVASGDFRVRSRKGFLDSSRSREVTMAVESTLLFGNSPTGGGLVVEVGEPRKRGRRMEVDLSVLIPLEQVTMLPVGERWGADLELRVAVQDGDGRRADIPVVPIGLVSAEQPTGGAVGRYETKLLLRRQPHDAVVAVYDAASGRILSTSVRIAP